MLDKKYKADEKEPKWIKYWEENQIYKFIPNKRPVFSIDTPPPTVNGKIHIGHIYSYSQTEMIARYKRLRGYNVFYPFGFDDNGLPSERLVEQEQNIKAHEISREEFSKLCYKTTEKYEQDFKDLFSKIGVSADWNLLYKTINPSTIKISQLAFLDLVEKEKCYRKESPALWCSECLTTIAQAELETKTKTTNFNYIKFKTVEDDEEFLIATTRPELLPAIVAVFVNPKDKKHKHLIGKEAHIPLIDETVKIIGDEKVAIDKGTGIVMCCTFGDQTDIEWWNKYQLPLKNILTKDGKINDSVKDYIGLSILEARKQIIEDLDKIGVLEKIEEISHEVQTHERCGKPVEYSVMNQWFIDIMNHKDDLINVAQEINWYPKYMYKRYEEWVNNVAWDWCISRQRYFGVYFPVWYCKNCGKPFFGNKKDLPINPFIDKPKITECEECGCKEVVPETDVMDTWATSSLTPLINMRYGEEENYEDVLKPMSFRMNAHDIIRTWDFYTIARMFYQFKMRPWDNLVISGFGLNSSGEKISKRKGNSDVTPYEVIEKYSADVFRYWSANSKLGTDSFFSEKTMAMGKKLVTKIWNVSKFVEMHLKDFEDKEFSNYEYIDRWILGKYYNMEKDFLRYLDNYEMGLGLNILEKFFWQFCDNYIEIVKHRLYRPEEFGEEARYSGQKTVHYLLFKLLQDFSIFFPFITEEIYQVLYKDELSIHLTEIEESNFEFDEEFGLGESLVELVSDLRGKKSENNLSLKTPIKILDLVVNERIEKAINESLKDFKAALFIEDLNIVVDNAKLYKITNVELDT